MKKNLLPTLSIVGSSISWGTAGLFTNWLIAEGFSSAQVSAFRMISAAFFMSLIILLKDKSLYKIKLSFLPVLAVIGVVSLFGTSFLYLGSIAASSMSTACILMNTAPFFVIIFATVIYKEKLTVKKLSSLALAFIGCVLVSGSGAVSVKGVLFGIASGITYASYSLICKKALNLMSNFTIMLYGFIIAATCSVFSVDIVETFSKVTNLKTVILIIGIGLVTSILPYLLYSYGLKRMDAGNASILAMLEPLVATVFGFLLFGQKPSVMGVSLIIIAVVILEIKVNKNERKHSV